MGDEKIDALTLTVASGRNHGKTTQFVKDIVAALITFPALQHLTVKIDARDESERVNAAIQPDGGLYSLGWYLSWSKDDVHATLDGEFTIEDLRAIAAYMEKNAKQ